MHEGDCLPLQAALWDVDAQPPSVDKFMPLSAESKASRKPRSGGLWTSTFLGMGQISGWAQWCRDETFGHDKARLWLLTPDPEANVVHVDTLADLHDLHERYGITETFGEGRYTDHQLDWSAMVDVGVDAMHLTDEGQWATRLSHPIDLYGWDCESTLWLRWAFVAVEDGGIVEMHKASREGS